MIRTHDCVHCNKTNIIDVREHKEHEIRYSEDGLDTEIEVLAKKIEITNDYKPREFLNQICKELKTLNKINYHDFFELLNQQYRINEDLWKPVIDYLKKKLGAYEEGKYLVIP